MIMIMIMIMIINDEWQWTGESIIIIITTTIRLIIMIRLASVLRVAADRGKRRRRIEWLRARAVAAAVRESAVCRSALP